MRPGVEGATRNAQYRVAPTSITPLAIHLGSVLGEKRPKHCQGVLLVRNSSPCSRMKTAKIVCCPGNLPKNPDEMQKNRPSSGFLPRNEDGTINPFCPGIFLRNVAGRHKAVPASLQASLAGTALNRWRSFLPSMMPAYQLACGLRIRRTRYNSNSK